MIFENNNFFLKEPRKVTVCDNCTYCALAVDGKNQTKTAQFPLSNDHEDLRKVDIFFGKPRDTAGMYKILSVCMIEVKFNYRLEI